MRLYRDHGELLRALATAAQRDPRAARGGAIDQLVGRPDADLDALVDTLHRIWVRTLYGV